MLVENDAYLLQLSYYIHRNPLRAGIVRRLASYRWSTYRAYAYGKNIPKSLVTGTILSQFANAKDPYQAYREAAQKQPAEDADPEALFLRAAEVLKCNPKQFRKSARVSKAHKADWDLLIFIDNM